MTSQTTAPQRGLPLSARMSANASAIAMSSPATRTHETVNERRSIGADTAERSARYLDVDSVSWLNLQTAYDPSTLATRDEFLR